MAGRLDTHTGLEYFVKQPVESRQYTFDFLQLLGSNTVDTIVSVVSETQGIVTGSAALTVGSPTDDNVSKVQVRLEDGTNKEDYKITATITDTGGNTLQGEGILKVRDL